MDGNNLLERCTRFVKGQGYLQGQSDHTLLTKRSNTEKILVLIVYVDDIIFPGDNLEKRSRLKKTWQENST